MRQDLVDLLKGLEKTEAVGSPDADRAKAEAMRAAITQALRTDSGGALAAVSEFATPREEALPAGTWGTWIHTQTSRPGAWEKPTTIPELRARLQFHVDAGHRARAVASGHSTSTVARPDDGAALFDLSGLNRVLPRSWEKPRWPGLAKGEVLYRVMAGITISDLNTSLSAAGLALPNQGTFDGQGLFGALSTGTHGSGLAFSSLAEMVASIDMFRVKLVDGKQQVIHCRVEPTDGPTDPAAWPASRGQLIQDDDVFHASVISFGCFGIVWGLTIRAVPRYWVRETHAAMNWSQVKRLLPKLLNDPRVDHLDILVNPYAEKRSGEHRCLLYKRENIPWRNGAAPDRKLPSFLGFLAKLLGENTLGNLASRVPGLISDQFNTYFDKQGKAPPFVSASYKALKLGAGHLVSASSTELSFALEDGPASVDTILALAAAHEWAPDRAQRWRHTSPLGVRFVGPSSQLLSQHGGRQNMTCEVPFILGTMGADLAMASISAALPAARPHWGQVNAVTLADARRLYGANFVKWHQVYQTFNASGTFRNQYTNQLGLDAR